MKLLNVKSVEEVKNIIHGNFHNLERIESLKLEDCWHRVLALDLYAPETQPPFPRSSVDGYAAKAQDVYGASETLPAFLKSVGEVKMGKTAGEITHGETKYIPTGGMIPHGSDAVIMVEYTEVLADQVMVYRQVAPNENIIAPGDDVHKGDLVLKKGSLLKESELGSLAALGINQVPVYEKPVVGIISTGNELVKNDTEKLKDGQIRDINSLTLASIARKFGAKVIDAGIATDNLDNILEKATKLLEDVDILLLSGGSSVGTLDFTAPVLAELSSNNLLLEGIAIKPGKPTLLAQKGNKAILGLPGHPVSAMMIFNYFGEILIDIFQGNKDLKIKKTCKALLTRNISSSAGRTDWVRVNLESTEKGFLASPVFGKSGLITTLVGTHGYIEIPPKKEGIASGSMVEVILWI